MILNKLNEISYYIAKGAGFKAKKPKPLDIKTHEESRVKAFRSAKELEREMERIRRQANGG